MISVEIDGFLSFWEHFRAFRAEIRTELRKSFRSMAGNRLIELLDCQIENDFIS